MGKKRLIITIAVVGVLVISLLASAYAFGWFKKNEKPEVKSVQVVKNEEETQKLTEAQKYQEKLKDTETRHKEAIEKVKKYEYRISSPFHKHDDFCKHFLSDFKSSISEFFGVIKLIEPVLQGDSFDEPAIKNEFQRCYNKNPYFEEKLKTYLFYPRYVKEELLTEFRKASYEKRKKFAVGIDEARENIQIYKVDFDNNPDNGLEYVIFSARFNKHTGNRTTDRVVVFNMDSCDSTKLVHDAQLGTYVNYKSSDKGNDNYYYGLIDYKGSYYIYQINPDYKNPKKIGTIYLNEWYTSFDLYLLEKKCVFNRIRNGENNE